MEQSSRKTDKRRVVNAFARCRHHKIKCTGDYPCRNCTLRRATCLFQDEEEKVRITKKRLSELHRRNCDLENENHALQKRLSGHITVDVAATPERSSRHSSPTIQVTANVTQASPINRFIESRDGHVDDDASTSMVNPLSCGSPKYITDMVGKPHYLGHTSTWSLTIQLLHLTHHALYKCPFPSAAHHVDSMTYDLQWNGLRSPAIPDVRGLPSLDHALFLINATKFHTAQVFHLFDEHAFMARLYLFYEDPAGNINTAGLWLIHFLVIIALGKAFIGAKSRGNTPPGANYFRNAFMMLPDYSFLWKNPCTSAEILCAFALYLQSIDWRTSAHNMIGQALRILQVHGYHTNVSSRFNEGQDLMRCQNIWWTVYVLERRISVLMGAPLSISDNDISASLPNSSDSLLKTTTTATHIKVSQAFSQVVNGMPPLPASLSEADSDIYVAVYRENRHKGSAFVKNTQEVLQRVAKVAPDLHEYFPVPEQDAMDGISRVSGYMNLFYHQCIMLATRPFLFILVEMCANSQGTQMEVPTPAKLLLRMCIESAKKTTFILSALQDQTLLECFLPFDLESAISAGLVITMASLVSPSLIEDNRDILGTLSSVLDQMIDHGNLIAANQKAELNQLGNLCARMKGSPTLASHPGLSQLQERMSPATGPTSGPLDHDLNTYMAVPGIENNDANNSREVWTGPLAETSERVNDMSPSQLLDVVDMLNGENLLDWLDLPTGASEFGNDGQPPG